MKSLIGKNKLLTCLLMGLLLIVIGEPYMYTGLMSLGTIMIFICVVVMFFMRLYKYNTPLSITDMLLFLFMFASVLSFLFAGEYNYERIIPLVCFLEIPVFVSAFDYKKEEVERKIYILFYIISLWYIFLNFSDVAFLYRGEYGEAILETLTLGFRNPNQTSIYLCFTFFVLIAAIYKTDKKFFKWLCIINSVILFFMILKTQSRAGITIATVFVFVIIIKQQAAFIRLFKNKALIVPVLFTIFILFFGEVYEDMTFLGEDFDTGRVTIFRNALDSMKSLGNIVFGNYREYAKQNLHNSIVSVIVEYGIVVAIIFVVFFHIKIKNLYRYVAAENNEIAFGALIAIFSYSAVEAAFFIAGSFYAVSFLVLYYLCLPVEKINMGCAENESITD